MRIPRVPERATSRRARRRSGRFQVPAVVARAAYGQYGREPGKFGGGAWQVARGTGAPPAPAKAARRSIAKFTAGRTSTSSNGALRVLRKKYTVDGRALLRT